MAATRHIEIPSLLRSFDDVICHWFIASNHLTSRVRWRRSDVTTNKEGTLNNTKWTLGLVLVLTALNANSAELFPDLPKNPIPTIRELPKTGHIVLNIQTDVLSGDAVRLSDGSTAVEIGVFDLDKKNESKWIPENSISMHVDGSCAICTMRASWNANSRQLFLALKEQAYVIADNGVGTAINLKMPGASLPYIQAKNFAIGSDGQQIAFTVSARDEAEKFSVEGDSLAYKYGKLYEDLDYESTQGSAPIRIAPGHPGTSLAWSPNGKYIAYGTSSVPASEIEGIVVVDLTGNIVTTARPVLSSKIVGDKYVGNVRWSPDGKKIGFILSGEWYEDGKQIGGKPAFYTVDADGQNLKAVKISDKDINVSAFAWSPSGEQIALRSDYDAKKLCNFNVMFYAQTGRQPCRDAELLYVSNSDGSGLKRISKDPLYRHGQLFWIQ
jgi:hypothetical protein